MTAPLQDDMADDETAPKEHRDAVVQRVRVGLTGLAAVFLLTMLAASVLNMLGQDDHSPKFANGALIGNAGQPPEAPKEPLAELGVAPGGNTPKPSTAPTATATAPMSTQVQAVPGTMSVPPATNSPALANGAPAATPPAPQN